MQTPILDPYTDQVQKNCINDLNRINQMQKTITALRGKNMELSNKHLSLKTHVEGKYQFQDSVNLRPFVFKLYIHLYSTVIWPPPPYKVCIYNYSPVLPISILAKPNLKNVFDVIFLKSIQL